MLTVPLFQQEPHTNWCGLYCLKMLYAYYGLPRDVDEIAADISLIPTGAYAQELGYDLTEQGFTARLVTRDTSRLPFNYLWLDREGKIQDLETRLKAAQVGSKPAAYMAGMARFLRAGGELAVDYPLLDRYVVPELEQERPAIVCVDGKALYADEWGRPHGRDAEGHVGPTGHYVVIVGIDDRTVTINDPSAWHGGVHTYPRDRFLYAFYSFQGYLLLAKRA
jgi:hypothetical protein